MPGTGELPAVSIRRGHVRHVYEDGTTRFVGIAAAPMIPNGPLAQRMRAAPYPDPAPKGVHSVDSLHRLAAIDTNIDALLGWGLVPHLQDGALVIDGMDALDAESRDGLERWFAHKGPNDEPRPGSVSNVNNSSRQTVFNNDIEIITQATDGQGVANDLDKVWRSQTFQSDSAFGY